MSPEQSSNSFPCVFCGFTLRASDSTRNVKCPQCVQTSPTPRFPIDCRQVIYGSQNYQRALSRLISKTHGRDGDRTSVAAFLHWEPENPHDHSAVCVKINNHLVGYVSNHDGHLLLRGIRQNLIPGMFWLPGVIQGGYQRKEGTIEPYSVVVCFDTLESMIVNSLPEPTPHIGTPLSSMKMERADKREDGSRPKLKKLPLVLFVGALLFLVLCCGGVQMAVSRFQEAMKQRASDATAKTLTAAEIRKAKLAEDFNPKDLSYKPLVWLVTSRMDYPESFEHITTRFEDTGEYVRVGMIYRQQNPLGSTEQKEIVCDFQLDGVLIKTVSEN